MNQHNQYMSFLLRLWQESDGDGQQDRSWRASLEKPQTGHRLGFASLGELYAFLVDETGSNPLISQHPAKEDNGVPELKE